MMCKKCSKISGIMILVAGVLFLLQDLAIWNFWGLNWYTVLFIIIGVTCFATTKCPDCSGMLSSGKVKKK